MAARFVLAAALLAGTLASLYDVSPHDIRAVLLQLDKLGTPWDPTT